jgi:regulator of replication initiation timing
MFQLVGGERKAMNNNQNPNQFSTEGEVGEIKTALGRLYKEFESFKLTYKADKEKDRAELQAWAQTSLIQNQLLSKAMATIELLTNELKTGAISWSEFEKNNSDFQQQLTLLLSQLKSIPLSSPTSDRIELKGLKNEVSGLKTHVREITQNSNNLTTHTQELITRIQELKNTSYDEGIKAKIFMDKSLKQGWYTTFGAGLFFLGSFFILNQFIPVKIPDDINNYLQTVWERTGFTNTKLERVEKYLGTDPNHKK